MKIQEEFYNQEIGRTYYKQYFTTQTSKPLNATDHFLLMGIIEEALELLMADEIIELKIIVKSKQHENTDGQND
jgi:hypothetical protein